MQVVDKLMMLIVAVSDMPKAKTFYANKLGLKVTNSLPIFARSMWPNSNHFPFAFIRQRSLSSCESPV
jgi:catechol 2,3-dioxygenase-like lactoylglutathione lyase family enzyme